MCEQCLVNPLYFGEVFPGWFLIRARRDGDLMKVGDWGLLECNDPSIIWSVTPIIKEPDSLTIAEFDARFTVFCDELYVPPLIGYRLVKSVVDAGIFQMGNGNFNISLFEHLAKWINNHDPLKGVDSFPHMDASRNHDYSLT
jgi:hypothetical protein